jgi:hypothetical protein
MKPINQIESYLNSLPDKKKNDLKFLHQEILKLNPGIKLWFLDGKNQQGKVVANPNIGYGQYTIQYADGSTKEFYRIGLSANTTGISVYIMGLSDKNLLIEKYADRIGKATVSGYCIKFKALKDISHPVLEEAILLGFNQSN